MEFIEAANSWPISPLRFLGTLLVGNEEKLARKRNLRSDKTGSIHYSVSKMAASAGISFVFKYQIVNHKVINS